MLLESGLDRVLTLAKARTWALYNLPGLVV